MFFFPGTNVTPSLAFRPVTSVPCRSDLPLGQEPVKILFLDNRVEVQDRNVHLFRHTEEHVSHTGEMENGAASEMKRR